MKTEPLTAYEIAAFTASVLDDLARDCQAMIAGAEVPQRDYAGELVESLEATRVTAQSVLTGCDIVLEWGQL